MPCDSCQGMADNHGEDHAARRQIRELQESNNQLTRMLCFIIESMQEDRSGFDLTTEMLKWYREHKQWDAFRNR